MTPYTNNMTPRPQSSKQMMHTKSSPYVDRSTQLEELLGKISNVNKNPESNTASPSRTAQHISPVGHGNSTSFVPKALQNVIVEEKQPEGEVRVLDEKQWLKDLYFVKNRESLLTAFNVIKWRLEVGDFVDGNANYIKCEIPKPQPVTRSEQPSLNVGDDANVLESTDAQPEEVREEEQIQSEKHLTNLNGSLEDINTEDDLLSPPTLDENTNNQLKHITSDDNNHIYIETIPDVEDDVEEEDQRSVEVEENNEPINIQETSDTDNQEKSPALDQSEEVIIDDSSSSVQFDEFTEANQMDDDDEHPDLMDLPSPKNRNDLQENQSWSTDNILINSPLDEHSDQGDAKQEQQKAKYKQNTPDERTRTHSYDNAPAVKDKKSTKGDKKDPLNDFYEALHAGPDLSGSESDSNPPVVRQGSLEVEEKPRRVIGEKKVLPTKKVSPAKKVLPAKKKRRLHK
ncbi:hypothetical protein AKO1_004668 [Acrasis kona]|uniref:Uncharacterized protein n=1 Tax=Acrasis kona TaxID=1008807 RepID=A0AAW2Z469_9EUKA